ncbi:hypothetical protein LV89_03358 [Arcicella aurantiaca]|uniref:Uncharacterized protein n=1 Tax=Arcicella aurantiaca TaxID=591202 RepID=A0A316DY41_9BACT|nr:hypothetical protein [Arcicella aurantiaca]PWK22646.1 hypothetical protein LV89_03358 [Arcicella aurantiaca]
MKTSILTLVLFFSCFSFVLAQKKYMVKVTTLDNKVYKGLMFQVRDKDFLVLPNSTHWDFNVKENNIPRTKSFDFGIVKNIKIRKRGGVGKGAIVGFVVGTTLSGFATRSIVRDKSLNLMSQILGGISVLVIGMCVSPIVGGTIGGSYPHKFEVKKDSISLQSLKTELKKYAWYHANESIVK